MEANSFLAAPLLRKIDGVLGGVFVFSVKTESQENHYGLKMIYPVTVLPTRV